MKSLIAAIVAMNVAFAPAAFAQNVHDGEPVTQETKSVFTKLWEDPIYWTDGADERLILWTYKQSLQTAMYAFQTGLAAREYMNSKGITAEETDHVLVKLPTYAVLAVAGARIPILAMEIPNTFKGGDAFLLNMFKKYAIRIPAKGVLLIGSVALPVYAVTASSVALNRSEKEARETLAVLERMVAELEAEIAKY